MFFGVHVGGRLPDPVICSNFWQLCNSNGFDKWRTMLNAICDLKDFMLSQGRRDGSRIMQPPKA